MARPGWWDHFSTGSTTHLAVVLAFVVGTTGILLLARRLQRWHGIVALERAMVAVLTSIVVLTVVKDLLPGARTLHWLPLQICDITGLIAAVAMATRYRPARTMLHYWGLTLAVQGFVCPPGDVGGPATFSFWSHFVGHSAVVGAALYDLVVRGYRPDFDDLKLAVLVSAAYVAVVLPLNATLGRNYGFIGDTPHAVLDRFGPWPNRVPVLMLTAYLAMLAMTLAWRVPAWLRGGRPETQAASAAATI